MKECLLSMGLARGARSLWKKSGIMLSLTIVGLSSGLLAATSLFSITAIIQLFRTDWKVKNSYKNLKKKSKQLLVIICFKRKKRDPHFYHNNNNNNLEMLTGGFFRFFWLCTLFITASSDAPQRMLGSNPGLLLLLHWQSDALTSRLNLIHNSAISHPLSVRSQN